MTWQPIDTAKKDGTVFLAFLPEGRLRKWHPGMVEGTVDHVWLCTWDSYSDRQSGIEPGWIEPLHPMIGAQNIYRLKPTHWMPLPDDQPGP